MPLLILPARMAIGACHEPPCFTDVFRMFELKARGSAGSQDGTGRSLGENRVAELAVVPDKLSLIGGHHAVVAAETAGEFLMTDMGGVDAPASLHGGEDYELLFTIPPKH